jgi:hypothetical protein
MLNNFFHLCVSLAISFAVFAQAGQRSSSSQPKESAFQDSWKTIPNTFKGDDIVSLIQALSIEKGQFESTEKYNERLSVIATRKEKYAFFADPDSEALYNFDLKYNPDKQRYNIEIFADWRSAI